MMNKNHNTYYLLLYGFYYITCYSTSSKPYIDSFAAEIASDEFHTEKCRHFLNLYAPR